MALDGAYLYAVAKEISDSMLGARVDKISQPSKEELMIVLRGKGETRKLILSANADSPRIHFTEMLLENPQTPPLFCMLLRKHIGSGKLLSVTQSGMDRVLTLSFQAVNELGDSVILRLIIEIMGRHSNIILVGPNDAVIDSIKRIPNELSSVRMIIPGVTYRLPPSQDKLNLMETDTLAILERFDSLPGLDSAKAIMQSIEGISPLLAREIIQLATKGQDIEKSKLSAYYKSRIAEQLDTLRELLKNGGGPFTAVFSPTVKLQDFTLLDITQYGASADIKKLTYTSPSGLLDEFYAQRDRISRMKQRSGDLLKLLMNLTERITKKLTLQEAELLQCADRDKLKIFGDLLNANLYTLKKGDKEARISNFYEENSPEVLIELDPRKTPAQNAQYYYAEYRKAATAEKMLTGLMEKSRQEIEYIDSVFDAVYRTQGESELLEIRQELAEQGYIRSTKQKGKSLKAQPPIKYTSSDGFPILCGRNNKQNDQLTLKTASKQDLWLHTQGTAGSHVILICDGKEPSDTAITEAAMIAAYNSKAQDSAKVPVDYTYVKYVKKPVGSKPGMVIFTNYYTAYVTPEKERVEALRI